jgi:hypothetical protein
MKRYVLALGLLVVASSSVRAEPAKTATAAERLARLKALVGTWGSADEDKDGKPDTTVTYRLTGGGSAVLETLFPDTPKEMATVYTVDGDDLVLTHYCAMGNQPHMKAAPGDETTIAFAFTGGGNMKSRDEAHMDSLTVKLGDGKTFHQDWTMWKDGKVVRTVSFDWTKQG